MTEARDRVLRAMTDDGSFRVVATRTTDMVRGATAAQGVRGAAARTFGELLTGANDPVAVAPDRGAHVTRGGSWDDNVAFTLEIL